MLTFPDSLSLLAFLHAAVGGLDTAGMFNTDVTQIAQHTHADTQGSAQSNVSWTFLAFHQPTHAA